MPAQSRYHHVRSLNCRCQRPHLTAFELVRHTGFYDAMSMDPLACWMINAFDALSYDELKPFTLRGVDARNGIAALIIARNCGTRLMKPTHGESPYVLDFQPMLIGSAVLSMYVPEWQINEFDHPASEAYDLAIGLRQQYGIWVDFKIYHPEDVYVRVSNQAPGKFRTSLIQYGTEVPGSNLTYLGAMNLVREYARQLSAENGNARIIWE